MEHEQKSPLYRATREKVDKVAEAVALMEQGTFEFQDGKPKYMMENGERIPRVVRREAMQYGGYASSSQAAYNNIFNTDGPWHQYYTERLGWHRQRLSGGFKQALAEITDGGTALRDLSAAAYTVLMQQLTDPDAYKRIKPDAIAKIYLESTKLDAQLKGEADTRRPANKQLPSVLNVIQLPESHQHRLATASNEIEGEIVESECE